MKHLSTSSGAKFCDTTIVLVLNGIDVSGVRVDLALDDFLLDRCLASSRTVVPRRAWPLNPKP